MTSGERALSLQFKQALGPLNHLDCTDMDTVSAHRKLGQETREQIWRILAQRLSDMGTTAQVAEQMRKARRAQKALAARLQNRVLDEYIRIAVQEYIASLSAWAEGARLAEFQHPLLRESTEDTQASAYDLATFLQEDEVGCQTGALRDQNGGAILWHTEEDMENVPGERFDKLRIFSFKVHNEQTASGFIYPDLLPGPSFAWQTSSFTQAIDTLHVKPVDFVDAILPNTLAWLSLYLGEQGSCAELAEQLGPFRGGYALTATRKKDGRVDVEKVEFANDAFHVSQLARASGTYLLQTNIIRDLSLPAGAQEQTSPESRQWNEKRLARMERFMQVIRCSAQALPLIFRMLRSRLGNDSAFANHDVKAYLVCRMAPDGTRIWVGCGTPMPEDELFCAEYV